MASRSWLRSPIFWAIAIFVFLAISLAIILALVYTVGPLGKKGSSNDTASEENSNMNKNIEQAATTTTTPKPTTPFVTPTCPVPPILIYQKVDTSKFFDKTWADMKVEQGSLKSNYWKGLDAISKLTQSKQFLLQVQYVVPSGLVTNINYTKFLVGDESTGYQLSIGGFAGLFVHNAFESYDGLKFSTKDRNNAQAKGGENCARALLGAWWYKDCTCDACLTQAGASSFVWKLGFTSTTLAKANMTLICLKS